MFRGTFELSHFILGFILFNLVPQHLSLFLQSPAFPCLTFHFLCLTVLFAVSPSFSSPLFILFLFFLLSTSPPFQSLYFPHSSASFQSFLHPTSVHPFTLAPSPPEPWRNLLILIQPCLPSAPLLPSPLHQSLTTIFWEARTRFPAPPSRCLTSLAFLLSNLSPDFSPLV